MTSSNDRNSNNQNMNVNDDYSAIIDKEIKYYDNYTLSTYEAALCKENLLIFWNLKNIQINLPIMRLVGCCLFICIMSSCPSERVFSELLNILTNKRSSMKHYHASMVHLCHGELTKE